MTRHVAFGLELRTSFPLPGMRPAAATQLPSLDLELADEAHLRHDFSGAGGGDAWRGRLGDGLELSIERGSGGDALFAYGPRALYLLSADGRRLTCAPRHEGPAWLRVLIGKVLPIVAQMRGYEALHAAAVAGDAAVLAILAPAGTGKSSLALELLGRGYALFADDIVVLECGGEGVRAHPGAPHMNLPLNGPSGALGREPWASLGEMDGERWVCADAVVAEPRPLGVLCTLERGPGLVPALREEAASPLRLAPYMLGLPPDAARHRSSFDLYGELAASASFVHLTGGPEHGPGELADLIEPLLAGRGLRAREAVG
jgi:hypothetical protein